MTLLAALNSPAASGNWTNNAASVWSAATNWSSNPTVPGTAAGDTVGLTFDITANRTVTIDTTSRTVGTLNIGDPTSGFFAYTLAASGGANLTFNNNGSGALLAKPMVANTALDLISAPITLADNLTIDTAATGSVNSLQLSGVISESGVRTLTKNGPGGIYVNGANTFSGGTILNAGEIQFNNNLAFGTGPLTINGGSLTARIAARTITNAMAVGGDFTFISANAGGNSLTLTGNLELGAATRTITVASTANPSGFITGIISGGNASVGLTKAGASTLNLAGANTFSGDTRIAAGSVQLSPSTGAPTGTSLALQNSTVDLNAVDSGTLSFRGSVGTVAATLGGLKGSRNQSLINSSSVAVALTVGNNGQSTTYSGVLSGSGGSLTKIGAGTLILSGANTYDGTTTISGGSLQLGDGGSFGSLYASGYIQNDGNLTINRNSTVVQGADFGGGSIGGSGSFTQAGTGTTTFTMGNSYAGTTTVSAGKLEVSSDQTGTGAVSVAGGAALGIKTSSGQWQPTTLTLGTGTGCTLEFNNIANAGTTTAPFNPGSVSRNGTVMVNLKSISGVIVVGGSGYPVLGNMGGSTTGYTLGTQPPGVSGHLAVAGSTLTFVVDTVSDIWNAASPGDNWDVLSTASWAGNAANNSPANTFKDGDSVLFNDTVPGPQTVTVAAVVTPGQVNVDNTATEYSIISSGANNIGGTAALAKSGAGNLTLSGPNTYSGGTTLSAGQMNINDGGTSSANSAIGAGPLTINGGALGNTGPGDVTLLPNNAQYWNGDFAYAGAGYNLNLGTGAVTPNASRQINVTANTLAVGGVIGGGAVSLTKTGNGTLTLSGANTFSGGTILSAGQLNINNGGSSSANSAVGTGTLTLNGGTIDNTSASGVTLVPNNPQVWGGSFTYAGSVPQNLDLGQGTVTLTATPTVTVNGGTLSVGGVISGAFGITKTGAGTLALLNANTFGNNGAADTLVNGGTLVIGNDSALGTSRLNLGEGSTIQSADSSARVITNALNFGGNTTYAGTGNLKFTRGAANGTPKTMTVNNPVTEFSGVLSGTMSRTVAGTGLLIYSGANTYSQGTSINPGARLQLGSGGASGSLSTSGTIDVQGTLIFNRSNAVVQGVDFTASPITGAGSVVQAGSGTLTLNAPNSYTGLTTVNNGELFLTPACQGSGDVLVANNAKFGVSAGSVSNSATIGNLTLGTGGATTLDFSYGFAGNPTNAALVAGAVTISGTSAIRVGGTFAVGTFPVLKYNSLSGAFAGTVAGPRGVTATLVNDTVNHLISVTVSSVGTGIVWTGTNNVSPNLWDLNTTLNWLLGSTPTDYIENVPPGDAVTFNDFGSGLVLLNNTVSPAGVTISNALVNYTFQGTGQINAAGGLTKVGAGTVTLEVPGTFSGSTVLSNGAVNFGANQTFANLSGNSALSLSTGTPTLTINDGVNTTFSGNIAGATLTKTGNGVLSLTGSNSLTVNLFAKAGGLTLDSGSISANSFCSIGLNGTDNGTLTLKGTANFTAATDFNTGDVGASVGAFNIQDTASLTANAFYIGSANSAGSTASGTVNQTGGTVIEQNTTAGTFCIGGRASGTSVGGVGVYNVIGGTLNAASAIRVGSVGVGTLNQSGGTVIANAGVDIATIPGAVGTCNLDGGILRTLNIVSSSTVNSTLNLNGGLVIPTGSTLAFVTNMMLVNVRNGGAIVDTTNFDVTISSVMQHSSIGGDNLVDGGLTKRGLGKLSLTGLGSSYTGPTVVTGGMLDLAAGSVANLNNVTINNAGIQLGLGGGATTFSAANVVLAGNSALYLNYGLVSGTPVTALGASGSLTVSGTTMINVYGYGFAMGQFPLVTYTGTPLANLNDFALGALPYGVTANLVNNTANHSIDLMVTAVSALQWVALTANDGLGSSSFNSGLNWQDFNAPSINNGYFTGGFLLRSPADSSAHAFGGAVLAVDAKGQLLLKGTGAQTINVDNLLLNGGLVLFGVSTSDNLSETLTGAVTLQSGLTSIMAANGSAGAAETLNVTAPISGGGNLQINGISGNVGTIVLTANNTYTGSTTVAAGTLVVNGANGNSAVTVNANATLGGIGSIGGTIAVQLGGTLSPGIPARGALTSAIGTLTSGNMTVGGTMLMKIDRGAVPGCDKLVAPSIVVNPGATLTVSNLGSTAFAAGDTFTLFSTPVTGAFGTVNLPPLPDGSVMWTNRLAVNGTIAVIATTINTNGPVLTNSVSGGILTLSWSADYKGWTLQAQTNSLAAGLGTNWVDVPGSTAVNAVSIPIATTNGAVFYRLKL